MMIVEANILLMSMDRPEDIAYELGFFDQGYFSR